MSGNSTPKRSLRRFQIRVDEKAIFEVQFTDRRGLPIREDFPYCGLRFATPTSCKSARAYGLKEGELLIVDLGDNHGVMAYAEDCADGSLPAVYGLVQLRDIVARGVAW